MINLQRLHEELQLLPIAGCSLNPGSRKLASEVFTRYTRIDGEVGVDWQQPPTSQQLQQASNLIQAHDGTPTTTEKLDALPMTQRLLAALVFRASAAWGTATANQKAAAQGIIDTAGIKISQVIPL